MNKADKELAQKKARILDRLLDAMQDCNAKFTFEGKPYKREFILSHGNDKDGKHFHIGMVGEEKILDELDDFLYQITEGRVKQ